MDYKTIHYEKEGNICILTLNRPRYLNALSKQLVTELRNALDEIEKDEQIGAIIINGAPRIDGRPCFSAGVDLKEQTQTSSKGRDDILIIDRIERLMKPMEDEFSKLIHEIQWLPKIVIAAIDGICTAGGTELALSCDIRTVAETAEISDLHIKNLGRIGGGGIVAMLTLTVGPAWAKDISITGDPVNGENAFRIGLANHVFPSNKLMEETKELARKIAYRSAVAVRVCKAAANLTIHQTMEQGLRYNYLCCAAIEPFAGRRESIIAFFNKNEAAK